MIRTTYIAVGWVFVILGGIGIFLPLLPTTPFMIAAAACFSRSSPRLHAWLLSRPVVGPVVKDWERHGVIAVRVKLVATATMLAGILISLLLLRPSLEINLILLLTISLILLYIWSRPSERSRESRESKVREETLR